MTLTRKQIADAIDGYDAEIAALQESKRETYADYREQLAEVMGKETVKAEIEGVKAAIKRRQAVVKKGETAIEERDALVEEIFSEITASRAPRATRENIEEFDAEILETDEQFSAGVQIMRDRAADYAPVGQLEIISPATATSSLASDSDASGFDGPVKADINAGGEDDTGADQSGATQSHATDKTGAEQSASAPYRFNPKPFRPHCQNPQVCAAMGNTHCHSCLKALTETGVAA